MEPIEATGERVTPESDEDARGLPALLGPSAWDWRFGIGLLLVSLGAALFAVAFRWSLSHLLRTVSGVSDVVGTMQASPLSIRLLFPALGGLLAGLIGLVIARAPAGHGVGDVMEAVVLGHVRLSMRTTLLKSAASWLAIVCGGSLGREGPLIQFGGAAGKVVSARLGLSLERARILIAAGTSAGFAAAYNTPFAAVLFVLEVVTGMVVLDAILPALVATVIATAVTRVALGDGPLYGVRAFTLGSPGEFLAYAGLGVVAALGAQLFMRLLSTGEELFHRSRIGLPWRPALGGLLAGAVIAFVPQVAGNGYEPLAQLLDGKFTVGFVALLLLGKAFATTASVSSGSPGGVFTPILLVGGALGFLFAEGLTHAGLNVGPSGGYVLVGMAAATAASTHAPLMAAVMIFELSGDYAIALPLILATAIATVISRWLRADSIYTAELRKRGVGWEVTMEGRRAVK